MTQKNINTMDIIVSKMASGKTLSKAMKEVYIQRDVQIPYREEWLNCKIKSLKMSMRTTSALLRNKMETINDVVAYTENHKITDLPTFGRISAMELFESILDYCWKQMSQDEKDEFIADIVERNRNNLRSDIEL